MMRPMAATSPISLVGAFSLPRLGRPLLDYAMAAAYKWPSNERNTGTMYFRSQVKVADVCDGTFIHVGGR